MRKYIVLTLKGFAMGVVNAIPGVSGGTIALISGIYEELIDAIKSFDIAAARLLLSGRFRELADHVNLWFLIAVLGGACVGIVSMARPLDYLFTYYPVFVWAFFFGLILGSVYFVGREIKVWSVGTTAMFLLGVSIAVVISILNPATENSALWYVLVCGIVAMCSMILPGLSGSFVLILMGNYHLVMIEGVKTMNMGILLPFGIGAAAALIAFSHFLSWIFKKFRQGTLGLLTGFVLGSVAVIWPWKKSLDAAGNAMAVNRFGAFIDAGGSVVHDVKSFGYRLVLPESFDVVTVAAACLMLLGVVVIWAVEASAQKRCAG